MAVAWVSFVKSQFVEEKGEAVLKMRWLWESVGGTLILLLVSDRLPWQMICQCSVFLEHQEYRDFVYDFIIQLVPLAFPFLLCSQYVELIHGRDLLLLHYTLGLFRVLHLQYM